MNEGNELYDESFARSAAAATSGGGSQTIGDNTYFADNSSVLSFDNAQVDNSTNIGVQGSDLSNILGSFTAIASQSVSAMSETAAQLTNQSSNIGEALQQYKTPILYVVGAGILFFLAKQLKVI